MRDVRGTAAWATAEAHFSRLHALQFGRPHRLLDPAVTADGTQAAVTGWVLDALEGSPRQVAYRVHRDELLPLLPDSRSSRQPRFSPDGNRLLLLSDEASPGSWQLVLLSQGQETWGAPTAAPTVPGSVEAATWSPDGRRVLLVVAGLGADIAGGLGSGTTSAQGTSLPDWHPMVSEGTTAGAWRSLWTYTVANDTLARWSPDGINVWEAAWLGAEAALVVTSPTPDESAWYSATLQSLDQDGRLTPILRPDAQIGLPCSSPSGHSYAIVEAACSDRCLVAGDLKVGTRDSGDPVTVRTDDIDVTHATWLSETVIGIAGLRRAETVLATYDVTTGKVTVAWSSRDSTCGLLYPESAWTADGTALFIEEGHSLPQRVVTAAASGVTTLVTLDGPGTAYLCEVAGSVEHLTWAAPDGTAIDGLFITPSTPGPHALIVSIHGGPVWAARNAWPQTHSAVPWLVAAGYAVLCPNPRGSGGRGQHYARMVQGDMGGADTWDITWGVDTLVAAGRVDPARVGLIGGSYGGFMTCWLTTQDQRWAAAVAVAPVTNWSSQHFGSNIPEFDRRFLDNGTPLHERWAERSPVLHAGKVSTPCLLVAGGLDRCTPASQAEEFHNALLLAGCPSQLAIYPHEGHGVRSFPAAVDFIARVLDWFGRHMPAQAAIREHTTSAAEPRKVPA